jgi:threonine/homoserine/homoserine lactone efflux protein
VTSEILTIVSIGLVQMGAVISPGPSFLVTAQMAVAQKPIDGIKLALGFGAGTVIWSSAALLGLNVLFHAMPALFLAMKIFGALFLMWIAYKIFRHASVPLELASGSASGSPFMKGFLVQLGNPKVAVFFGSIFVAMLPAQVPLWMTVVLIAMVALNEVWWYSLVALFFGSGPVRGFYLGAKAWIDRVVGVFLGAVGLRLIWAAISE